LVGAPCFRRGKQPFSAAGNEFESRRVGLKLRLVQMKLRNGIASGPSSLHPSTKRGAPHISLVFREIWDATALHVLLSEGRKKG
jgi:hypothetical protein